MRYKAKRLFCIVAIIVSVFLAACAPSGSGDDTAKQTNQTLANLVCFLAGRNDCLGDH
jgi:hypothetical protein